MGNFFAVGVFGIGLPRFIENLTINALSSYWESGFYRGREVGIRWIGHHALANPPISSDKSGHNRSSHLQFSALISAINQLLGSLSIEVFFGGLRVHLGSMNDAIAMFRRAIYRVELK